MHTTWLLCLHGILSTAYSPSSKIAYLLTEFWQLSRIARPPTFTCNICSFLTDKVRQCHGCQAQKPKKFWRKALSPYSGGERESLLLLGLLLRESRYGWTNDTAIVQSTVTSQWLQNFTFWTSTFHDRPFQYHRFDLLWRFQWIGMRPRGY